MTTSFLSFWTTESSGINFATITGIKILAGSTIPFSYFPLNFQWLQYNPFAWCFYHPMQIYLGKYSNLEIFYVFLGGIFWCIILYYSPSWFLNWD
jgi:ABC-type uncharacterized transport system permease subunit